MKCVGYDTKLQRFLIDSYPQFIKEEIVRKEEREAKRQRNAEQRAQLGGPPARTGTKRKRAAPKVASRVLREAADSPGPMQTRRHARLSGSEDEGVDGAPHGWANQFARMSRGTRSRPRNVDAGTV